MKRGIYFLLFDLQHVILELGLNIKNSGKPSLLREAIVVFKFTWNMFVLCFLLLSPFLILSLMVKNLDFIMSLV